MTATVYRSLAKRARYEEPPMEAPISNGAERGAIEIDDEGVGRAFFVESQPEDPRWPIETSPFRVWATLVAGAIVIALSAWSVLHSLRSL